MANGESVLVAEDVSLLAGDCPIWVRSTLDCGSPLPLSCSSLGRMTRRDRSSGPTISIQHLSELNAPEEDADDQSPARSLKSPRKPAAGPQIAPAARRRKNSAFSCCVPILNFYSARLESPKDSLPQPK